MAMRPSRSRRFRAFNTQVGSRTTLNLFWGHRAHLDAWTARQRGLSPAARARGLVVPVKATLPLPTAASGVAAEAVAVALNPRPHPRPRPPIPGPSFLQAKDVAFFFAAAANLSRAATPPPAPLLLVSDKVLRYTMLKTIHCSVYEQCKDCPLHASCVRIAVHYVCTVFALHVHYMYMCM